MNVEIRPADVVADVDVGGGRSGQNVEATAGTKSVDDEGPMKKADGEGPNEEGGRGGSKRRRRTARVQTKKADGEGPNEEGGRRGSNDEGGALDGVDVQLRATKGQRRATKGQQGSRIISGSRNITESRIISGSRNISGSWIISGSRNISGSWIISGSRNISGTSSTNPGIDSQTLMLQFLLRDFFFFLPVAGGCSAAQLKPQRKTNGCCFPPGKTRGLQRPKTIGRNARESGKFKCERRSAYFQPKLATGKGGLFLG